MAKTIKPDQLGKAIEQELTMYHESVIDRINAATRSAVKALVKKTKATAPKDTGDFVKHISSKKLEKKRTGSEIYAWYVKPPLHRITHLLVHGHATVDGGRVPGDPFLHNAWEQVQTDYEQAVKEAVKGD